VELLASFAVAAHHARNLAVNCIFD
jgi:hypothetical protein